MNRVDIDESAGVVAHSSYQGSYRGSDLRRANPWLASYQGNAMRASRPTRPSRRPARSVRLWTVGLVAVALTFAITAGDRVAAQATGSSPSLDRYLATLEQRATERKFLLTFGDLLFSADSAQIGDSEKSELVRMADFLRAHPATLAQVVGYADDRGDATANSRLAEQRAAAVHSYLVAEGIDPSRLTVVSSGADSPLPNKSTQSARAGNRRVKIVVQRSPMEPLR
jgi:outer membrane protein OmpA-like peptidoglycan-associated protein